LWVDPVDHTVGRSPQRLCGPSGLFKKINNLKILSARDPGALRAIQQAYEVVAKSLFRTLENLSNVRCAIRPYLKYIEYFKVIRPRAPNALRVDNPLREK